MLDFEDSVLVSISGGPDSVFLLYFLNLIKKRYKLNLYAFHLDHMTRNGDSAKDAVFVKNLCLGLNIPLFSEEINVSNSCHERKLSFQEGARIIRRELLEKYLLENSIKKIAIAHNADDNIETFLMNLIRGTGLKGLGSISPVRGAIIRPLIDCSKLQIINFLNINNIAYCIDKTNSENRYFRNKIRNRIVPYIENEMGKGFKENILNTIILLRSGSGYIDGRVIEIIKKIQKNHGLDIFACARKGLLKIPAYDIENLDNNIKTFLVYKLIELVKGTPKDIISINVSDILKFCFPGGESKKINLPGGIVFIKEAEFIYIYNSAKISFKDLFSDLKQNESASISAEISQNEADNLLNSLKHVKSAKHRTNTAKAVDGTNASSNTNALSSPDILKEDVFNGEIVKSISGSNYRLKIKIINAASYDKKQIIYSGKNEAYMDLN
ncbi:MAG: tRNA lysidine(34) synthetase TilS, partial [Actinomycetota bacterium]